MPDLDFGIDLGTVNVIITSSNGEILLNEPSVVAYNKKIGSVIAVGDEAYDMVGRTPEYITVIKPLKNGVVSDHSMAEIMIREFVLKITRRHLVNPRIVMCVPSSVTEIERRAVVDVAISAGARKVYLIEEPVAALLGAGVDISVPDGNMVVDIGGGTTDVAVVSLNGIVKSESVKTAGDKFNSDIIKYVGQKYRVLIGEKTAEQIKLTVGNVYDPSDDVTMEIKGRNLVNGLPKKINVSEKDFFLAVKDSLDEILDGVHTVLESTPPELSGDIYVNGVVLTGGGAMVRGLDEYLKDKTNIKFLVAKDPAFCVAKGTAKAFELVDSLLDGFESVSLYKSR